MLSALLEGEYNNGIREGKGKYIWEDNKYYKGEISDAARIEPLYLRLSEAETRMAAKNQK